MRRREGGDARTDGDDRGCYFDAGERKEGRPRVSDSLTTPIVCTSTYHFKDTEELIAYQEGRYGSFEYGRYGNPTTKACEEKIRQLEGGEDALLSASGMCRLPSVTHTMVSRRESRQTPRTEWSGDLGCAKHYAYNGLAAWRTMV